MNEQTPAAVERSAKFPDSLRLDSADVSGVFSADGSYSYQFDGPLLRAYDSSGAPVSQFNFTKLTSSATLLQDAMLDTPPSILCVCPFNRVNVLVGLEHSQGQGLLCLLNIVSGLVLRVVALSHGVTVLATIHGDSVCTDLPYIGEELQNFSGIVACGTARGHVLIIDLVLDKEVPKTTPLRVHVVDVNSDQSVPDRKQLLATEHKVIAYSLACLDNPEYFTYLSASRQVLHYSNHDDIYVSSLKFLPQMASLCVGYNFGSYQIWRIDPITLEYSSPYKKGLLPVSHFCHQEPENDPRCFSYLWVARCNSLNSTAAGSSDSMQEEMVGSMATITLFQLSYEQKTLTDQGGTLFRNLIHVGGWLEHELSGGEDMCSSWVVSCDTLSNIRSMKSVEDDSQLGACGTDLYLSAITWRVRYMDNSISSHLALFDINRWYHAQMPRQIRCFDGWCSYFSQYRFDDAVATKACLDLYIDTSTITCYKCPLLRKLEKFTYPSSLGFEVKFLLADGVASAQYNGVQRQSLYDVVATSTQSLVEPQNAFQLLRSSGLIANNSLNKEVQRKGILTTVLLHTHVEYIIKCIHDFSISGSGPVTAKFIMSWLWERQETIIHQFDTDCVSLYDWSAAGVDALVRHSLLSSLVQSKNIIVILEHLLSLRYQLKIDDLSEKLVVSQTRFMHMKLVWWCVNRGLLPETGENVSSACFRYPSTTLKRSYNSRHSQLLASASSVSPQLMIDMLASGMGTQLQTVIGQEGGNGTYPPPNIKALLDVFLIDCDLSSKLLYFTYTMLDLMSLVDSTLNESLSTHMHSLLSCLKPGCDHSHLASVALALWHLDHHEYQDLVTAVRQPGVTKWLTPNLHEQMLKRLLAQGQAKVALSMTSISSTVNEDTLSSDLLVSIYLANGMISEAVNHCRASDNNTDNFTNLIRAFKSSGEMSDLLCLQLTDQELDCIEKHLDDKDELDKLVVHYLQIGNLEEAVKLNAVLNDKPLWKGDMRAKERAVTRDRLVKWQLSLLPPIQKKLLEDPHYLSMRSRVRTRRPQEVRRSFFFKKPDSRVFAPFEIAELVMDARHSVEPKPFIHNLTSSLRKSSLVSSAVRRSKAGRSITGLFDPPALSNRSPSKRRGSYLEEVSAKRSNSDESLMSWSNVKSLLKTPLVKRRSGLSQFSSSLGGATPHSILKVRKPQIVSSPNSVSGRLTPTSRFSNPPDEVKDTAAKSVTRVKFDVQLRQDAEESDSLTCFPKSIDFTDDEAGDRSISDFALAVEPVADPNIDDSEIEFNFGSPMTQVMTGKFTGVTEESIDDNSSVDEESFVSLPSESSPHVVRFGSPAQDIQQQSDTKVPDDLQSSPLREAAVPVPAAVDTADSSPSKMSADVSGSDLNDSLRSLSSLDDEAQLQGLKLRDVRESVMNRDSTYLFSPLSHAAPSDAVTSEPVPSQDFTFSTPTIAPTHTRTTRSSSKASVTSDSVVARSGARDATAGRKTASKGKTTPHKARKGSAAEWDDEAVSVTAELKSHPRSLEEKKTPTKARKTSTSTSNAHEEVKVGTAQTRSPKKEKKTSPRIAGTRAKVERSPLAEQEKTSSRTSRSSTSTDSQSKVVVKGKKTPPTTAESSQNITGADLPHQLAEKKRTTPMRAAKTRKSMATSEELDGQTVERKTSLTTIDTANAGETNEQVKQKRTTPTRAAKTRKSMATSEELDGQTVERKTSLTTIDTGNAEGTNEQVKQKRTTPMRSTKARKSIVATDESGKHAMADQPMHKVESEYAFSPLTNVASRDASVDVKGSESFAFAPPSNAGRRRTTRPSLSRSTIAMDTESERLASDDKQDREATTPANSQPVESTVASKLEATSYASKPEETTSTSKPEETTSTSEPEETTATSKPEEATSTSKPEEVTSTSKPEEATPVFEHVVTVEPVEITATSNQEETSHVSKQQKTTPGSEQVATVEPVVEITPTPKLVKSQHSMSTSSVPVIEEMETELEQKFEFSPVTTVASALTSVEEGPAKTFTFTTPTLAQRPMGTRSTRSAGKKAMVMEEESHVTSTRAMGKKPMKPIEITLPSDESSLSQSSSRYRRNRSASAKKKPTKPLVIPLSEQIFTGESTAAIELLAATSTAVTAPPHSHTADTLQQPRHKSEGSSVLKASVDETILAGNIRRSRRTSASDPPKSAAPSETVSQKLEAVTAPKGKTTSTVSKEKTATSTAPKKDSPGKQRRSRMASSSSEGCPSAGEEQPVVSVPTGRPRRGRSAAALSTIDEDQSLRQTQSAAVIKAPAGGGKKTRHSSVESQEAAEAAGDKPTISRGRSATPDVKATSRRTHHRTSGSQARSTELEAEPESSNRQSRLRSTIPEVKAKATGKQKSAESKPVKMTSLKSTKPETNRLRMDVTVRTTEESPPKTHTKMSVKVRSSGTPTSPGVDAKVTIGKPAASTSSARRGRPRKDSTQSATKSSSKSVKKSEHERKSTIRTRSSLKKPDVSPILFPPPTERVTRVRRKL